MRNKVWFKFGVRPFAVFVDQLHSRKMVDYLRSLRSGVFGALPMSQAFREVKYPLIFVSEAKCSACDIKFLVPFNPYLAGSIRSFLRK